MSADDAGARAHQRAPAPAHRPRRARACSRSARSIALVPARPRSSTTCSARGSAPGAGTSSRPTRPAARSSATPSAASSRAILGTIEIVALATAIAVPFGDRRRALPRRVRQDRPLRERRALLRRRDDGRAVDRLRPLHLHHARGRPASAAAFAGWKGSIALALLMLPGRHALGRGRAAASCPTRCARRRSRSARRAGGSSSAIVLPTALPGLVTGSLLAVARAAGETAPLLFTVVRRQRRRPFDLGEPDELAADPDLQRRRPGPRPPRRARLGRGADARRR